MKKKVTSVINEDGCTVQLLPQFLDYKLSMLLFNYLNVNTSWNVEGRRKTAWYSNFDYAYSNVTHSGHKLTDPILVLLLQTLNTMFDLKLNSVLLNLYTCGFSSLGYHSDDEPELGDEPTILSLSLNGCRTFELKNKLTQQTVKTELPTGSLLLMSGLTQKNWLHRVPKSLDKVEPRINITLRHII